MKISRFSVLFLLLIAIGVAAAAMAQQSKKARKKNASKKVETKSTAQNQFEVLYENANSDVEEPFVLVARNAETYAELQKKVANLPSANSFDFKTTTIVAAFAGIKPTPGYEIVFTQTTSGVKIDLTQPPPDAILAQVLTAPVKIVAVPIEENKNLKVELGANWQNKASVYRITSSEFEMSGGFAGISQKFELAGTISVLRTGEMATAIFDVSGTGDQRTRKMIESASGKINNDMFVLAKVEAGSLIDEPHPSMLAKGIITDEKLILRFEPLPTIVADGFQGRGRLEAVR